MSKNTFSPSMTLAGMDYIAPSAACIKPTMMRTQPESSEVSHAVGRHTHHDRDNNDFRMELRGNDEGLPAHPEVIKITLQDCLACSGCVTTAETILVNAQSREELLRTRAEQWDRANNNDSEANATNSTNGTTIDKEESTNESSMPPWLITISEQSASSIAAYLSCSVIEAYVVIGGFMEAVLTHNLSKIRSSHDINEKINTNLVNDITNNNKNISLDTSTNVEENSCKEITENDNDTHHICNADASLLTKISENPCQHGSGQGVIYISDLRWASRLSSQKTSEEYERRINNPHVESPLPLLVSACPGWVCYCEKQGATLLPHLCPVLSPQGLAGSLAKRLLGPQLYHVSVQPCFDRKLEAARDHVQRSELIRDYNRFCKTIKGDKHMIHTSLLSSLPSNREKEEEMQKTQKCYTVDDNEDLFSSNTRMQNTKIIIEKTHKEDSKTEGESDQNVFYTDCVISTLELLEWMREVDPTFPWRRELNSIDDVEYESQYKSLSSSSLMASEQTEAQSVNRESEEEEKQLQNNNNSLEKDRMNIRDDKLTSSFTLSDAKVQENADEIALWEGSGGYHRHVIHYMLSKQLNKGVSKSQKEREQIEEEVSEEEKLHSNNHNDVKSEKLAAERCALNDGMERVRYEIKRNRNHQLITTPLLPKQTFCVAYGFQQIQNIVRGLRKRLPAVRSYTFVEMMACPEGCLNGGGQIRSKGEKSTNGTAESSFDEHEQFSTATKRAFAQHIIQQVKQSTNANNKINSVINTEMMHNSKWKEWQTNVGIAISNKTYAIKSCFDANKGNISDKNNNSSINENCKSRKSGRHREESSTDTLVLFSFAAMSKFAEWCGPTSWLCKFTDRQKEFEQMLNEGNLHSLK